MVYISRNYFGRHKTGGANLAAGIAYQDLVSILYSFEYIRKLDFKMITFESDDDFTIIFDNYEMYVQVKKEKLTDTKIKDILKNKKDLEPNKRHVIVASQIQGKLKKSFVYLENVINTEFNESKKFSIHEEFKNNFQVNDIPIEVINNLIIEEIPESKLMQLVKYSIHDWAQNENLELDVEGVFDSLISNITMNLRPNRGYLNKQDIVDICLKYPKKKGSSKNYLINNSYWAKDNIILLSLQKYTDETERFVTELTILKMYIENQDYIQVEKLINDYSNYMQDFELYKLWIMYKLGRVELIHEYCDCLIETKRTLYYAYYFKSIVLMQENNYYESILYANKAYSIVNSFEINLVLAKLYYLVGETVKSRNYYNYCLKKQSNNCEVLVGLSALLPADKALEYIERSIKYDPDFYMAYLEKGKILRSLGKYKKAIECFYKYLKFEKNSRELYRELSLCLINLNNETNFEYLIKWLEEFLYEDLFDKMADGEMVLITDITANQTNIITCTKSGEDFKICSPISEFLLVRDEKSFITIGCIVDPFLKMTKESFEKSGSEFENGYEYIPSIMKFYQSENQFRKILYSFSLEYNGGLNKDYVFNEESRNEEWSFKEYICKDDQLEVNILEFREDVKVEIHLGEGVITGDFSRNGEGYFNFCSKIENPTDFSEFVLVLECEESREKIHIKTNVKAVKITKKPLF